MLARAREGPARPESPLVTVAYKANLAELENDQAVKALKADEALKAMEGDIERVNEFNKTIHDLGCPMNLMASADAAAPHPHSKIVWRGRAG